MEKIVITGIGVVTPFGDAQALVQNLEQTRLNGNHINKIESLDLSAVSHVTSIRKMDRLSQMSFLAATAALVDSRLDLNIIDKERIGAVTSTLYGPVNTIGEFLRKIINGGMKDANPSLFPNTVINASLGQMSINYKLKGFSSMTSGYNPVVYGWQKLLEGKADVMCVGGIEEFSPIIEEYYRKKGLFEKGIHIGEGACFIILERLSHAINRKAQIKAVIENCATYTDTEYPFSLVKTNKNALCRTILDALESNDQVHEVVTSVPDFPDSKFWMQSESDNASVPVIRFDKQYGELFSVSDVATVALGAQRVLSLDYNSPRVLITSINPNGNTAAIILTKYN